MSNSIMSMKTYKVYLNIYDFTTANNYISCLGLGGYHTGVEIKYIMFLSSVAKSIVIVSPPSMKKKVELSLLILKLLIINLIGKFIWEKHKWLNTTMLIFFNSWRRNSLVGSIIYLATIVTISHSNLCLKCLE